MSLWNQLADTEREAMVLDVVGGIGVSGVPYHLREGLVRYFSTDAPCPQAVE